MSSRKRLLWTCLFSTLAGLVGSAASASAGPRIELQPRWIGYGEVKVGTSSTAPYAVRNTGDAPLVLGDMTIATHLGPPVFGFDPVHAPGCSGTVCAPGTTLAPGETASFHVQCTPTNTEISLGRVTVASNAENTSGNDTVDLDCKGTADGDISVSPLELIFPPTRVERDQSTLTLTITNRAADGSVVFCIQTPGFEPPEWTFAPDVRCPGFNDVLPGESLPVQITFRPMFTGPYDASIFVRSNDPDQPEIAVWVSASGDEPMVLLEPPFLELGAVPVGQTTAPGTITARNVGRLPVHIFNARSPDPEFTVTGPTSGDIPVGGSVSWTVTCTPSEPGHRQADFNVDTDGAIGFQYVVLTCEGLGASLRAEPGSIHLGDVLVGTTVTREVRVLSDGPLPAELVGATSDHPRFSAAVRASLPVSLPPGTEVIADVTFAPVESGQQIANITFDAATGLDATLQVVGNAVDSLPERVVVLPPSVDFGPVKVGKVVLLSDVSPDAITLTNVHPTATFTIARIVRTGSDAFRPLGPDRTTLAPGESAILDVEVAPVVPGIIEAELEVYLDADSEPVARIALTARAIPAGEGCRRDGRPEPSTAWLPLGAIAFALRRRRSA